jgi:hypothetical protein
MHDQPRVLFIIGPEPLFTQVILPVSAEFEHMDTHIADPAKHPVTPDEIFAAVGKVDAVVCAAENAYSLYALGAAHATTKPAIILVSSKCVSQIDFRKSPHAILYDTNIENWESDLQDRLKHALRAAQSSWRRLHTQPARWSLSGEIRYNWGEIRKSEARNLLFFGVWGKPQPASLHLARCETRVYDSEPVRLALANRDSQLVRRTHRLYKAFMRIEEKAAPIRFQFSLSGAREYLKAVREVEVKYETRINDMISELEKADL